MKERNTITIKLLASHILLIPVLLIAPVLADINPLASVIIPQTILLILFFAGYWEFFGIRNKWLICMLFEAGILISIIYGLTTISSGSTGLIFITFLSLIELYLFFVMVKIVRVIFYNDKESVEIEFPFRGGQYLVTDGGNSAISRLMNYHFHSPVHKQKQTNYSMLYATDIVKLGDRGSKFMPAENKDYLVFGQAVYCPVEGSVFKVVNDIEDNVPFSGNYPYNTGNTVVIKNHNYYLLLGHLKKGSIVVRPGEIVNLNDKIGECGNSGMSERPHLHMQLMKCDDDDYWKGLGINIKYRGKNLYKNRVIRI